MRTRLGGAMGAKHRAPIVNVETRAPIVNVETQFPEPWNLTLAATTSAT
jgi:hypothetical protein